MSEQITETDIRKKPGRKPSPLTAAQKRFITAKTKADKARKAHEKVDHIAAQLREAEAEEAQAYEELQAVLAEMAPGTVIE